MTTINIEPTPTGYANSARLFAETILNDVRKPRQDADRAILVELMKIVAHLHEDHDRLLANLLVAIEQDEPPISFPSRLLEAMRGR